MGLYLSKEFFTSKNAGVPLIGQSARQALHRAEILDSYRQSAHISFTNRIARKTLKYEPSLYPVNKEINTANAPWPNGIVIWMDPDSDGGLPHTRPPHLICLPSNISDDALNNTLLHERVHVSQRIQSEIWLDVLESAWSMTTWAGQLPTKIEVLRRINPDLILAPVFQWKKEWVPFALFKSMHPTSLSDVNIVWWHVSTSTIHNEPPSGWTDFFGPVNSGHEHPYEMAAYMVEQKSTTKAFQALEALLKTNLI